MDTVNIQLEIPAEMAPYVLEENFETAFERNAMLIYPFVNYCHL